VAIAALDALDRAGRNRAGKHGRRSRSQERDAADRRSGTGWGESDHTARRDQAIATTATPSLAATTTGYTTGAAGVGTTVNFLLVGRVATWQSARAVDRQLTLVDLAYDGL
jgi:hypothetical protein